MLVAAYSLARIYTVNKADVQCVRQRLLLCIPINLTVSQRDRHQHFSYALNWLHHILAIVLRHLGYCALQRASRPPLPPFPAHLRLACALNRLQRRLNRQTTSIVRNQMRSLWFGDKEAHGDLRGLVMFRNHLFFILRNLCFRVI